MILLDKALKYCNDVVEGKEITTDEVKLQCKIFLEDYYKNQYFFPNSNYIQKTANTL